MAITVYLTEADKSAYRQTVWRVYKDSELGQARLDAISELFSRCPTWHIQVHPPLPGEHEQYGALKGDKSYFLTFVRDDELDGAS